MAIIYTYPVKTTPVDADLVLISDSADSNKTKNVTIQGLVNLIGALVPGGGTVTSVATNNDLGASSGITFAASPNPITTTGTITTSFAGTIGDLLYADTATSLAKLAAGTSTHVLTSDGPGVAPTWKASPTAPVTSVSGIAAGTSSGTATVVTPTTGLVTIQPMAYAGTTNVGHVPTGGSASTFLRGDGTWVTPTDTDTTYTMSAATDGANVDLTLDASAGTDTTIQFTAGANMTLTRNSATEITFASTAAGTANGWDIINFAQAETLSDNAAITYFYQVVVPEDFTANKAKIYVSVAAPATFVVGIYNGVLSNLAATTKLGDGTVNPSSSGIVEVALSPVSAGDLDLTKGQNVIIGFAQTLGDKLACISGRLTNSVFGVSATGIPPMPSNLNGLEESGTTALRPCCVLYQ